ncbi:MAG TPA: PA2169 family four-helix-bundle protein [Frateuria sp.]|uniref:PA2169 family four-helix-bundle protein n=1 Tax=Frateuria sp. TaxID=2211372 RepID=UPI002D7E669A|nr:PA2169 family four-helix-bundle protein [Frateuria sp.]HET6805125.1 PA2169 family four-helix-bundle protein [Frateuria sp.]
MQNHDIRVLNDLIETTIDSAEGYAEAARETPSPRYSVTFHERASERRLVATRLQQKVEELGGTPEDEGSVLASAHRMFTNLRKSLHDDTAVIDEVERGEDHIKHKFEDALDDDDVSPPTRALIADTFRSVRAGHDQMRGLKRAAHRAH